MVMSWPIDFYAYTEDSGDLTDFKELYIAGQCLWTHSMNLLIIEFFKVTSGSDQQEAKILKQCFPRLIKMAEMVKIFPFQSKLNQEYAKLLY